MSRKVYYYSRTGTCAKVADSYTKDGGGYKVQVQDNPEDRYKGILGFIKGAINTLTGKIVSYTLMGDKYAKGNEIDEIVLITPVWAGKVPPAFRSFLLQETLNPGAIYHVITVSQSGEGRDAFHQVVEILQKAGIIEIRHKNLKQKDVI